MSHENVKMSKFEIEKKCLTLNLKMSRGFKCSLCKFHLPKKRKESIRILSPSHFFNENNFYALFTDKYVWVFEPRSNLSIKLTHSLDYQACFPQ